MWQTLTVADNTIIIILKQLRVSASVIQNIVTEDDQKPSQSTFALTPTTPPEAYHIY
jgi:hypothetical protein